MKDYPNIEAIANGIIAGAFRDWVRIRPEAKELLAELKDLRAKLAEAQRVIGLQGAALEVWKKAYPTVANPTFQIRDKK